MPNTNVSVGATLYTHDIQSRQLFDASNNSISIDPNAILSRYTASTVRTVTGTTYAFVAGNPATITSSANNFISAGFRIGETITITGSSSNNVTASIVNVTVGTLTLSAADTLVNESAGSSVTIKGDVTGYSPISSAGAGGGTGDASAANQVTGNNSLSSIDGKLTNVATSTKQDTGNASLSSIDGKQTTANTSLSTIATNTLGNSTSANQTNRSQKTQLTDGTNDVAVKSSDTYSAGGSVTESFNAARIAGASQTIAISLDGTTNPTLPWIDLAAYPEFSLKILTNSSAATMSFQTAGNSAGTNPRGIGLVDSSITNSGYTNSSTSSVSSFGGKRIDRYFRISTNLTGANTITAILTLYSVGSGPSTVTISNSRDTGTAAPSSIGYNGIQARNTTLPANATQGNISGLLGDLNGRQIVRLGTLRALIGATSTTITSTTETTIIPAAASTFNDITLLGISNTSATAVRVDFRDTTAGSILFSVFVDTLKFFVLPVPTTMSQTTINTNWTAQLSTAVTDVRIFTTFEKNL